MTVNAELFDIMKTKVECGRCARKIDFFNMMPLGFIVKPPPMQSYMGCRVWIFFTCSTCGFENKFDGAGFFGLPSRSDVEIQRFQIILREILLLAGFLSDMAIASPVVSEAKSDLP